MAWSRIFVCPAKTYEYAVLVQFIFLSDFDKKGLGIGRKLIEAAESHALKSGAEYMEIEILRAKDFDIPSKVRLHKWYLRQDYVFLESVEFVARKPKESKKATRLLVPSVFDCYRKPLS